MSSDWKQALGWREDLEKAFTPHLKKALAPARVSLVYRKQLRVLCEHGERWARVGGRMMHRADNAGELPAVGDWVAARIPQPDGEALVQEVLPRRSAFIRKVPGQRAVPHVLAANVDSVLVVMGLDADFNLRRLERFLTLAWESRAAPVVVLNKRDVCEDLGVAYGEVAEVARGAPVFAVSARTGEGLDPLRPMVALGQTVVLLGSSGVGKSTLVNQLAGAEVMPTGGLREDGKGRHTTTRRELLILPSGGAVIDTPGLREVQLWDAGGGLAKTFDDIEALAVSCRFRDCQHEAEPGCAVKQALTDGALGAERLESFHALQRELAWLKTVPSERGRPESKRRARVGHGAPKHKRR